MRRRRSPDKPKWTPPLPGKMRIAIGAIALALFFVAQQFPYIVESSYGRDVYPGMASLLGTISGIAPFSFAEWVFAAVVLSLLGAIPWYLWRMRRRGEGWLRSIAAGFLALVGRAAAWWCLFVVLWGLNYARPLPAQQFDLARPLTKDRREALVGEIGKRLDAVRARVREGRDGLVVEPEDYTQLDRHIRELQVRVLAGAGFPPVKAGRVKRVLSSPVLLRWGVSGFYGPFTGEPNLVWPARPAMLPFTLAHERAHLSGFASEEAASFVAMLTCWLSERPEVRYAGWLSLFLELRASPKDRAEAVRRDIRAIAEFQERHRGREAPRVWKVYDGYLKAHGVPRGMESYARAAGLALRWLDRQGMPPEPPPEPPGPSSRLVPPSREECNHG
jgi:hypothetical protein